MDATHERTPGRRRISSVSLCFFSRYCDCDRSVVFLVLFFSLLVVFFNHSSVINTIFLSSIVRSVRKK